MTEHTLWLFAHILLFVYWLGADLGVLLLARAAKQPSYSFAERAFALKMALLIDTTPRVCFALMFPVGLQLVDSGGFIEVPPFVLALVWIVAAAWIGLLMALGRNQGTARAEALNRFHLAFQGVVFVVLAVMGAWSLYGDGPFQSGWLATKVLLFGAVFALGIGIDFAFRPVAPAFASLATEGSSPATEARIAAGIDGAIRYVLTLYALLIVIGFLGVAKPF
jgi:hypothetical protein